MCSQMLSRRCTCFRLFDSVVAPHDSRLCLFPYRLPDIRRDVDKQLDETSQELEKLPRPSSSDPVLEIIFKVSSFFEELKTWLDGTPDADGLVQTLRPACERFRKAIQDTEPDFQPTERRGGSGAGPSGLAEAAAGLAGAAATGLAGAAAAGLAGAAAAGLAGAAAAGLAGLAGGEIPRRRPTGLRARGGPRAAAAAAPGRPQNGSRVIYLDDVTKRMNEYVPAPP